MIANLVGADWRRPETADSLPIFNRATGEEIERVPLSGPADVDEAVRAARAAFEGLAAIVTRHHGKTLDEARGEVRRGIEVVDFACGAPTLLQGRTWRHRRLPPGLRRRHAYPRRGGRPACIRSFPRCTVSVIRLTMAQALVRFLAAQHVERDGVERRFFEGCFGIFHGNVAGVGQALGERPDLLRYYQARNEQAMVHAASGFARMRNRLATLACTTSVGPGATNMVTGAAQATINRLPVLLLPGDVFASRRPDPVLQQLEVPGRGEVSVNDCFQPVSRYQGYASIGALSRSLGTEGFGARDLEEFRDALVAARAMERTVVVHVPADRYEGVPSYECWWDVPVAEVSETESVQEARAAYERSGADRRWYVAPSEDRR